MTPPITHIDDHVREAQTAHQAHHSVTPLNVGQCEHIACTDPAYQLYKNLTTAYFSLTRRIHHVPAQDRATLRKYAQKLKNIIDDMEQSELYFRVYATTVKKVG